jgi:hypothetical protein
LVSLKGRPFYFPVKRRIPAQPENLLSGSTGFFSILRTAESQVLRPSLDGDLAPHMARDLIDPTQVAEF